VSALTLVLFVVGMAMVVDGDGNRDSLRSKS
jgi:hypothetical protein